MHVGFADTIRTLAMVERGRLDALGRALNLSHALAAHLEIEGDGGIGLAGRASVEHHLFASGQGAREHAC
jgi:hypothetical protein